MKHAIFNIELVTPAIIGGFNNESTHLIEHNKPMLEPPRPTDIAGKTRWYLRSLIGGIYYELTDKHLSISQADKIASLFMGSASNHRSQSKIKYYVEIEKASLTTVRYCLNLYRLDTILREYVLAILSRTGTTSSLHTDKKDVIDEYEDLLFNNPRMIIQILPCLRRDVRRECDHDELLRRIIRVFPLISQLSFKLHVLLSERLYPEESYLLGLATGFALHDLGLGRIVSRGFGKVSVRDMFAVKVFDEIRIVDKDTMLSDHLIERFKEGLYSVKEYFTSYNSTPEDLFKKLLSSVEFLKDHTKNVKEQPYSSGAPLFPIYHPDKIVLIKLRTDKDDVVSILNDLSKIYMKEPRGYIPHDFIFPDIFGQRHNNRLMCRYGLSLKSPNRYPSPLHIAVNKSISNEYVVNIHYFINQYDYLDENELLKTFYHKQYGDKNTILRVRDEMEEYLKLRLCDSCLSIIGEKYINNGRYNLGVLLLMNVLQKFLRENKDYNVSTIYPSELSQCITQ